MNQNIPQTYAQKVMLLKSRFKNTKDLWLFMTDRRKYSGSGLDRRSFPDLR